MAKKNRQSNRSQARASDASTRKSIIIGEKLADGMLRKRAKELRRRAEVIKRTRPRKQAKIEARFIRAVGPKGIGTLVAEGDSWFDYPFHDVLKMLESEHGYDIESAAHASDRVEDMAYADKQVEDFRKILEKMLRREELPKAILLSGGGNDVAGDEFHMLLDHAISANRGLNEDVVRGVVDVRIRNAYVTLLAEVTKLCVETTGHTIPIIVHGYGWPVPDGRGYAGGWGPLPGPWLRPGFYRKGFLVHNENQSMMRVLINRFNQMVDSVSREQRFKQHVRYVDLRDTLPNGATYEDWWANELHPTRKGFKAVAKEFAKAIAGP